MRRIGARRSGWMGLVLGCAAVAASPSGAAVVERWSSEWTGWADDFEDGVLADGDPGEPDLYGSVCGDIDDADETGGRIRLTLPHPSCPTGRDFAPKILLGADTTLRARFAPTLLPMDSYFAIRLANQTSTQRLVLMVRRGPLTGPATDDLGVLLYYNATPLEGVLLSLAPASFLAATPSIELELSTALGANGTTAVPHGRVRLCPLAGCSPADLFADLADQPGAPPGAVSANQRLQTDMGVASNESAIVDLLDWSVATRFEDEFDGVLSDRAPYVGSCAEGVVAEGALAIDPLAQCTAGSLTAAVTAPGPAVTQATFAWTLPAPCSESYGILLTADRERVATPDGAGVQLGRGPIPGIGDDVLYVLLEAHDERPKRPWLGIHVLGTTPEIALPGVDSIEMRLEERLDVATGMLLPVASVRTCAGRDCEAAGASFQQLMPFSFPQDDPDRAVCGLRAADLAPPPDGGAMDPEAPRISVLLTAPEPSAALAGGVASGAALAGWRRRRTRSDSPR